MAESTVVGEVGDGNQAEQLAVDPCENTLPPAEPSSAEAVLVAAALVPDESVASEADACAAVSAAVASRRAGRQSASSSSAASRPSHRQRKPSGRARTLSEEQLTSERRVDSSAASLTSSHPPSTSDALLAPLAVLAPPPAVRRSCASAFVALHRLSSASLSALRSAFRLRMTASHQKAPQPRFVHKLKELTSSAHSAQSAPHRPCKPHLMRSRHHPLLDVRADAEQRMPVWMVRCLVLLVLLFAVVVAVVFCRRRD